MNNTSYDEFYDRFSSDGEALFAFQEVVSKFMSDNELSDDEFRATVVEHVNALKKYLGIDLGNTYE